MSRQGCHFVFSIGHNNKFFTRSVRQLHISSKVCLCLCLFTIILNISWSSCKVISTRSRSFESLCLSSQSKRSHLVIVIDGRKYTNADANIDVKCQQLPLSSSFFSRVRFLCHCILKSAIIDINASAIYFVYVNK